MGLAMKKPQTIAEAFEQQRYVYLQGVLTKEVCQKLTQHMFDLEKKGELVYDPQCPKSNSVYGDPLFDKVLDDLTQPLSEQLGIQLYPTYSYARIYKPGEILERHIDRESCEISGTMTVGYDPDSHIWPIKFALAPNDEIGTGISINTGDMVMYRGNELPHWREAYKGKWQFQIFFHYVDANGPHKEWKFDKRPSLGMQKPKGERQSIVDEVAKSAPAPEVERPKLEATPPRLVHNGVMISNDMGISPGYTSFSSKFRPHLAFTKDECEKIIQYTLDRYSSRSMVGTGEISKVDLEIRRVEDYQIEMTDETQWVYDKIAGAVAIANREYFNFELLGITHSLQLLHYKSSDKGFYTWHTDVGHGSASTRKISVVVMLSEPTDYVGGNLILNNLGEEITADKERGSVHMFPSYVLHTVTPVEEGERWVLVVWVHGSEHFR